MKLAIPDCQYDFFISYASKDNEWSPGYIEDFSVQLKRILDNHPDGQHLAGKANIFIDKNGFPPAGDISDVLGEAVDRSAFLIVFLSRNYLKSKWCFKELDRFRNKFSGQLETTFKRMFLLVIDPDAENEPWADFLDKPERPKFIPLYGERTDGLIGYPIQERPNEQLHKILTRIAKYMIREAGTVTLPPENEDRLPQPVLASDVILGAVTEDLEPARAALQSALTQKGIGVFTVGQEELRQACLDDVNPEFTHHVGASTVFVQLYSHAKVLIRSIAGGHLKYQQQILDGIGLRPKTLWCLPANEADVIIAGQQEYAETDDKHRLYINQLEELAQEGRYRCVADVVERLSSTPVDKIKDTRLVYIESTSHDKELSRRLINELKRIWRAKYGGHTMPDFYPLPWAQLEKEITECLGLILVFGTKDSNSLRDQVIKIDRKIMDFGRDDSLERLIMVAPPQKPADGDMFWRTFPFDPEITNPESLDQILEPVVDSFHRMLTLSPATA